MGELARTLQHEHASAHATLDAVTAAAAVRAVPGAEPRGDQPGGAR